MRLFFIFLAVIFLPACRIDLTVNGDGVVQTETGSFDCGSSGTDCVQSYVTDVTQCRPGYLPPLIPNDPQTIPDNCTVIVADYATCTAMTNENTTNCILDTGIEEIFHALAGEGSDFNYWGGDNFPCGGQVGQTCGTWISADYAGTDAEVAIEANFSEDTVPDAASYTYNHLGQRKSKTVGATTTYFVYSDIDGQMLGEYNSDGTPIRQYLYAEGERMAMYTYDYSTPSSPTKTITYFANNHIGQTVLAWNAAGAVVYERNQTPFGETKGEYATGGVKVPLRFAGQYYDSESGFNQNWNRDYDPSIGRYLQPDPLGLDGGDVNIFSYVGQNPVMATDPDGLQSIAACGNPAYAATCTEAGIIPKPWPVPLTPRDIWWPDKTPGQWSCKARADCNDNIPGNCPEDPKKRFAFGGGIANDLGSSRNAAKSNATSNLQCQPKHVSCKCTGPKGEQYSGGC